MLSASSLVLLQHHAQLIVAILGAKEQSLSMDSTSLDQFAVGLELQSFGFPMPSTSLLSQTSTIEVNSLVSFGQL